MTSYLRSKSPGSGKRHRARQKKRLARKRMCDICGKGLNPSEATVDHIVPRSRGGCSEAWNLRAAHSVCNARRGNVMEDSIEVRNAAFIHRVFGIASGI